MSEIGLLNNEQVSNNSAWGEEYLKDISEFASERKFVELADLAELCDFDNSMISGHGTASAGNGHEVVEDIFEEGVKGFESLGSMVGEDRASKVVGSTDLMNNTVGLWSSMEGGKPDFAKLKRLLDNWPHRKAENIILMRFPLEYYHAYTDVSEERTQAYFTEHQDKQGQPTNYIDRRFIIGNYNTGTGQVELNPNFEPEIAGDFEMELDDRLRKVREQTRKRQAAIDRRPFGFSKTNNPTDEKVEYKEGSDSDSWDDSVW